MALMVCSLPNWRKGSRGVLRAHLSQKRGLWTARDRRSWGQSDVGWAEEGVASSLHYVSSNPFHFIHCSWKSTSRETLATVPVCTVRTSQCFPSVSVGKGKEGPRKMAGPLGRSWGSASWGLSPGGRLGRLGLPGLLSLAVSQAFRTSQVRPW